jgi:hypothetical protein
MSETEGDGGGASLQCAECGTDLRAGMDFEATEEAAFCRPCFNNLTAQVQMAIEAQGREINYAMAVAGAVAGGVIGVLAWWGFTVLTNIAFGLIAVVIGFTVGKGAVIASGDKRSRGLQVLSALVATVSFFYASYLVNRTFIQRAFAEESTDFVLPLLPSPELFVQVIGANFGIFDLVFLAIVAWQAWQIPAPLKLSPAG